MGGRRTWSSEVNAFVEKQLGEGIWSPASAYGRRNLLFRIGKELLRMRPPIQPKAGSLTVMDISRYIQWLAADSGLAGGTQRKALLLLADFLKKQARNYAGEKLRRQFPPDDLPTAPRPPYEVLARGFDRVKDVEDPWQRTIARGQAALYIGTMVRPSEGRKALYNDLDQAKWTLAVRHPKGRTRGREVGFLDDRCIEEMKAFIKERSEMLAYLQHNPEDPSLPLFPSINMVHDQKAVLSIYTAQGFSKPWRLIYPDGLDIYSARRGMAQALVDKDLRVLPAVSRVLGHSDIATTTAYYATVTLSKACDELRRVHQGGTPTPPAAPRPGQPEPQLIPKRQIPDPAYL